MSPRRLVMISEPWPVVLYLPAHSSRSPAQDQHGHNVPSTRATAPLIASAASCAPGRNSAVPWSTRGVRNVMYRDIVDWSTSKISAQISSVILLRLYPQVTMSASRRESSFCRPFPFRQGFSRSSATRSSSSSSCSAFSPVIRSKRNGFSSGELVYSQFTVLLEGEAVAYHLAQRVAIWELSRSRV